MVDSQSRMRVRVAAIRAAAIDIKVFDLAPVEGGCLPAFAPGAHISVYVPGMRPRQYSLCGDLKDRDTYRIAVLREEHGRGGSKYMHDVLRRNDVIDISPPANKFPLIAGAQRYLFIAGGIGITPILPMLAESLSSGASFSFYYCAKSPDHAAFRDLLAAPEFAWRTVFHFDGGDRSRSLDVGTLLGNYLPGTCVYCCGPAGLMRAVREATISWPSDTVHFEHFHSAAPDSKWFAGVRDLPQQKRQPAPGAAR